MYVLQETSLSGTQPHGQDVLAVMIRSTAPLWLLPQKTLYDQLQCLSYEGKSADC